MLRRKLAKQQRDNTLLIDDDTPKEKIVKVAFINDRTPAYILVITKVYTLKKPSSVSNEAPTPSDVPLTTHDSEKPSETKNGEIAQDDAKPNGEEVD